MILQAQGGERSEAHISWQVRKRCVCVCVCGVCCVLSLFLGSTPITFEKKYNQVQDVLPWVTDWSQSVFLEQARLRSSASLSEPSRQLPVLPAQPWLRPRQLPLQGHSRLLSVRTAVPSSPQTYFECKSNIGTQLSFSPYPEDLPLRNSQSSGRKWHINTQNITCECYGLPRWQSGTMQETQEMWVQSLDQEDHLEQEMATHCSILAWKIPWKGGAWQATVHGVAKSQTRLSMHAYHRHQC